MVKYIPELIDRETRNPLGIYITPEGDRTQDASAALQFDTDSECYKFIITSILEDCLTGLVEPVEHMFG